MADKIVVIDSEFHACIAAYRSSLQTMQNAVQAFENALDALRGDWTGRAALMMAGKVLDLIVKIKQSFERINDATSELNAVDALFTENEEKLTSNFNSLDAGSVSPFNG